MARRFTMVVGLLALSGAGALRPQDTREVILAAHRTGVAEVIGAVTLQTLARVHFNFQVEHLSASADGARLEVAGYAAGTPCCKHYTLDLATSKLEEQLPSMARDSYGACLVSPDGRWCFRLKSFRGPALKMEDLREPGTVRELIPPGLPAENSAGNWAASGVWSGGQFYLYVQRPDDPGYLWTVAPGAAELGAGTRVGAFGEAPGCRKGLPVVRSLVAAAGDIFLYEPFGSKADRTAACGPVDGGAWKLDPATGRLTQQIASGLDFNRLVADRSGDTLYGVVLGSGEWNGAVQLVRLGERDGQVLQSRTFAAGVLQIAAGALATVPAGDVFAGAAQ